MHRVIRRRIIPAAAAVFLTALLYLLFVCTYPVYFFSDNWEVAVVTAGYYGSNECQYIHPALCFIIKLLSLLFPTADVFTLLVHCALGCGFTFLSYLVLTQFFPDFWKKQMVTGTFLMTACFLTFLFLSEGLRIWNANYNIQTGAILFFGLVVLSIILKQDRSYFWVIAGTGLLCFGFMLRVAVSVLFLPYLGLIVLTQASENPNYIRRYIPSLMLVFLLFGSRIVILSEEKLQSAEEYNRYRTTIVDYPMKNWSELEKPTFAEADYEAAVNWFLADTDHLNLAALKELADAGSRNAYYYTEIRDILRKMWRTVAHIDIYMFLMFLLTCLLAIWDLVFCESRWRKMEALLAVLGSFLILYYLTGKGRAPLRVWQPVLFAADAVFIDAALEKKEKKRASIMDDSTILLLFSVLWYGTGQIIAHAGFVKPQNILTARTGADDSVFESTFQDETIYVWLNWNTAIPDYFIKQGKLPTARVMEHNIAAGDWTYGQVYYENFLKKIGAENPARALLDKPDTYLIGDNNDLILNYMQVHYGDDLVLEKTGEILDKGVYRLVRTEK